MRRALSRPALWAAALYALLAIAFVSPALMPDRTLSASDYLYSVPPWTDSRPDSVAELGTNFELIDQTLQFEPFQRYMREAAPDVPLWNPHVMAGRPFHANSQSAIFSPFSLPARAMPVERALGWAAALKLFMAAFGAYLLARALRLRVAPSLLAGIVYAFGLFFVAWLTWPLSSVWAWLPWLFALTELLVRRPGTLPAAGLSVVVALQFFGGHPESSFHVVFATLVFFVLRVVILRRERDRAAVPLRRTLAFLAGGLAGGALLAAVALVPLAEMILHSGELEERTAANPDKVRATFLAMVFLPDFWGRPTQAPLFTFINSRAFYAGALPLMLAVAAPLMRPNFERLSLAAFGLTGLAVVVGVPPIHQIVNALPVFSTAHNGRLVIYWLIAVAVLSAFGLNDLLGEDGPQRRRAAIAAVVLLCIPVGWLAVGRPSPSDVGPALETAWGFVDAPRDSDVIRLASLIVWLTLAGAAALLIVLRARARIGATALGIAVVALVAVDLFRIGMGINPAIEEEHARVPATGAIEYLQSRRSARFVGQSAFGTLPPVEPNIAMDFGLYDARGYDYPTEERYSRLWKTAVYGVEGFVIPQIQAPINARSLRALSLLSVADIVASRDVEPLDEPGLRLAYDGDDARVYANARALPRAFLVGGTQVVEDEDQALGAVLAPAFAGRRAAVVEEPLDGLETPGRAGTARIAGYERERVEIDVDASRPALLVLTDVHFPGWKATVDGEEADLERVNYLHRGVRVDARSHRVEFSYEPASWRIGWILSAVGLVLLAAAVAVSTASRRSAAAGPGRA
jgi:hypothetical protein